MIGGVVLAFVRVDHGEILKLAKKSLAKMIKSKTYDLTIIYYWIQTLST